MADHDINGAIQEFMKPGRTPETRQLVKDMRRAVIHGGRTMKLFLAEVCDETLKNGLQPVGAMGAAMMYGLVLGIIAERERANRKRVTLVQ